jgi:hypothetical protein
MVCRQFLGFNGLARLLTFVLTPVFTLISASFLYASPPPTTGTGGTLTVITVPERAEVWINNGYAGLTPIRDKLLPEGTYTLRLVDPLRQNSASETIVISEGERLIIERTLGGSYGKLRIDTDPQGAEVAIIAELGKTPLVNDYLTPGEYRLEIRHPNTKYMPLLKDVSFADGQPITISHKLEKPPIFTTKRLVQLGLGTGTALGLTWAIVEQHVTSKSKQESVDIERAGDDVLDGDADQLSERSKNAGIRRTIAIIAGASFFIALQITVFIW